MELKDFVATAIVDVVRGVEAAQTALGDDYAVGTSNQNWIERLPPEIIQDGNGNIYSAVNFDVAVTTIDEATGSGGIKVLGIGAGGEIKGRAETASRVSFSTIVRLS